MKTATKQSSELAPSPRVRVVSLDVNVCNCDSAVERIGAMIKTGRGSYICMSTVHMVMESHDSLEFGEKVNAANMVIPDGMPLVWMQKLQGIKNAGRVRGNDLMLRLFVYAEKNGLSVGFYGGRQEVINLILKRAAVDYPQLNIAYAYSPPFRSLTDVENKEILDEINRAAPDLLFVGLGCPKQERWMSKNRDNVKAVMIGVGAAFDFYAGNIAECPVFLQKLGLEWLFRLSQEPGRLWRRYLYLNPRFIVLAVMQLTGLRKPN